MRIALGQDVFARDGKRVGNIDRLVLNDKTHHVDRIVVHKSVFFSTDKLVERLFIDRVDEAGVYLSIDAAEEEKLPDYYHGQYYEWNPDSSAVFPVPFPGWYTGSLLYVGSPMSGRGYPGTRSFFELAPIDALQIRPESNMAEGEVRISRGTGVVSADDHALGHAHDILFDETGALTGLIVRFGLVHKHDLQVPAAWVAEIDDDRLRLTVTAAETANDTGAETA